jgi:hypothetical protein
MSRNNPCDCNSLPHSRLASSFAAYGWKLSRFSSTGARARGSGVVAAKMGLSPSPSIESRCPRGVRWTCDACPAAAGDLARLYQPGRAQHFPRIPARDRTRRRPSKRPTSDVYGNGTRVEFKSSLRPKSGNYWSFARRKATERLRGDRPRTYPISSSNRFTATSSLPDVS